MISAVEGQYAVTAGVRPGRRQGHQVGLGARIGEPDPLDRGEARADGGGEVDLVSGVRAPAHPFAQCADHRLDDDLIRVPVQPG